MAGRVVSSYNKAKLDEFLTADHEAALSKVNKYMHSETAFAYFLTQPTSIEGLIAELTAQLRGVDNHKVIAVVLDVHSTRSPCEYACPEVFYSLLRDNHDPEGFLAQLQEQLAGARFLLPHRFNGSGREAGRVIPSSERLRRRERVPPWWSALRPKEKCAVS